MLANRANVRHFWAECKNKFGGSTSAELSTHLLHPLTTNDHRDALTFKSDVAGVLFAYQNCTVPWFWYNKPPRVYVQNLHFITSRVYNLLILNVFLRKVFLTFVVAQSVFFNVFVLRMTALWLKRGKYVSDVVQ